MKPKRLFLILLIVSVSISALLGVAIILFGDFGEVERKVLGTSITITLMSLLGLACGASFERKIPTVIPKAGIAFAVISAIIWIFLIWANASGGEFVLKSVFTTTIFAVALSYISLLAFAALDRRFSWSRIAANVSVFALVAVLLYTIWYDNNPNEEIIGRVIGSLSVLISAITIIIPILHKLSGSDDEAELIEKEIETLKARLTELENRRSELKSNE